MAAAGNGILFGLLLTIFIGPVFFALIQTSVQRGFSSGIFMALGIALSDAFYIFITYLGVSQILKNESFHFWLGLAGGLIMVAFGIVSIFKPVPDLSVKKAITIRKRGLFRQTVKGFLLNGINPSVLVFWLGIASMASVNFQYASWQLVVFFAAIVMTVLLTDVLKAFVADRLKALLSPRFMKALNLIVGTGLVLFGLRLLYYALEAKAFQFLGQAFSSC